jgi:hypothetical protein
MIRELCAVSTEHTMGGELRGVVMLVLLAWLSVLLCHQPVLSVGSPGPSSDSDSDSDAVFYHYGNTDKRNYIREHNSIVPSDGVFGPGMRFQCNDK